MSRPEGRSPWTSRQRVGAGKSSGFGGDLGWDEVHKHSGMLVFPVALWHGDDGELVRMMASQMAVTTALESLSPRPPCLSSSRMTNAFSLVRWPVQVCSYTGVIFKTSSLRKMARTGSAISESLMGMENRELFQGLDLRVLDQAAQLGDDGPLLVLGLASSSSRAVTLT